MDNLSFTSAFGYMLNGDAYKNLKGYTGPNRSAGSGANVQNVDRIRAARADADDVWFNSRTFSF